MTNVVVVGLSYRTSELSTLEKVSIPASDIGKILDELQQRQHVTEVMLLSTCNRIEVYAVVETFHGGLSDISEVLARQAGMEPVALYENFYVHYAGAAVEHIFSVAAGLDSMVVGETQILGQVRSAYAAAREAGTIGRALHELVQTTLRVAKRVHHETGLDKLGASVVTEALSYAGSLAGTHALVLGTGSMGALAASQLRKAGVARITTINRTFAAAEKLAQSIVDQGVAAEAKPMEALTDVVSDVDVAVVCTGAQNPIFTAENVPPRHGRSLVVCDLGLPRDVSLDVADVPLVELVNLETIRRRANTSTPGLRNDKQIAQAAGVVLDEVRDYLAAQRQMEVLPTVAALRKHAAEVVNAELLRLHHRLPDVDGVVRSEVETAMRRVVDKLLHLPTVKVKQLASHGSGANYADALRELFGLDPQVPTAVTRPLNQQNQLDNQKMVLSGPSYVDGEI